MKVLIAIEPRSYREVIGLAIEELRPHLRVEVVEPGALQTAVSWLRPHLVFCSGPDTFSGSNTTGAKAWVEFRPYAATQAKVCLGDECSEMEDVNLDDILSVVDAAERLLQSSPAPKSAFAACRKRRSILL